MPTSPETTENSAASKSIANWNSVRDEAVEHIEKAVRESLKNPVGFPPIETAIIPDDYVCIAVEAGVPQPARVVAAIVDYLLEHGVLLKNIAVLIDGSDRFPDDFVSAVSALSSQLTELMVHKHDPTDSEAIGYLAATEGGDPITINRELIDADVVIPVCLARSDENDWRSHVEFLFPSFSNDETIERFQEQSKDSQANHQPNRLEAEEAMRWLGVYLGIHVQPGIGDSILKLITGERKKAIEESRSTAKETWHRAIANRCELLVVDSANENSARSWSELVDLLTRFSQSVQHDGKIVVSARFGKRDADEGGELPVIAAPSMSRPIRKKLQKMLDRFHIFLQSDLDQETTEDLGFGFLSSANEVDRLVNAAEECLFIPDANRCTVSLSGDTGSLSDDSGSESES